jgi:hypothetical protein
MEGRVLAMCVDQSVCVDRNQPPRPS